MAQPEGIPDRPWPSQPNTPNSSPRKKRPTWTPQTTPTKGKQAPSSSTLIHTAAPNSSSQIAVDYELIDFKTDISPLTSPEDWRQSNINHISSAVLFLAATVSSEIEQLDFTGTVIYQHLIIYVFVHLMHCTSDKRLLHDFKENLQKWKAWDDITMMENHQLIRDYLIDLWRRGLQPHPILHPESSLRRLLTLDDIGLSIHIALVVNEDIKYKQVLDRRGPGAQALLNLLQARLNFPVDSTYKRRHVNALIRLSRASRLYPQCLVLNGINLQGNPVAGGAFGDVYKGHYKSQIIAVKVLKVYEMSDRDKLLKEFSSEAVTWQQLSHHPNVLQFYGVYHLPGDPPRVCLVSPWMENGNLVQFLASCSSDIDCVPLYLDVAQGLEYLHSENIIHGDLKGLNILITPSQRACIADFGFATAMHSAWTLMATMSTIRTTGTLRWQAPELLPDMLGREIPMAEQHNTTATDVYAFALVGYEMFTNTPPFHHIPNDYQFMVALQKGGRPSHPLHDLCRTRGLNDNIWDLIENCWTTEPLERPSTSQIVSRLRALPDRPADQRPLDDFNISLPSQVLDDQINQPFSTLVLSIGTLTS